VLRQLDQRNEDELTVTLEWDPNTGRLQVCSENQGEPDLRPACFTVEPGDARFAFLHPSAVCTLREIRALTEPKPAEADNPETTTGSQVAGHDPEGEAVTEDPGWYRYVRWVF
jgi:hypothetical protein